MTAQTIPADEQLSVQFEPGAWRLHGPDGKPVLEAHPRVIYYHPLFGEWRDLPPGHQISVEGVESVQVRWDGGWAVGLTLLPGGVWRRLVRWEDSRRLAQADEAARALSALLGCPLRGDVDERARSPTAPTPTPTAPSTPTEVMPGGLSLGQRLPAAPSGTEARRPAQGYAVEDAADVRLPLRLGGGAVLARDEQERLVLTLAAPARFSSLALALWGAGGLVALLALVLVVNSGALRLNPVLGLLIAGLVLLAFGLGGVWWLARLKGQPEAGQVCFDRAAGVVTLPPTAPGDAPRHIPIRAVHGVSIVGAAARTRSRLAYRRTVALMTDLADQALFEETRPVALPPDPAVSPPLRELRQQADERAGPSLARAGARVIAGYLGVPLADE